MAKSNVRTAKRALRLMAHALPQGPVAAHDRGPFDVTAEAARRAAAIAGVTRRTQADTERYRALLARAKVQRGAPSLAQLATATVLAGEASSKLIGAALSGGTWAISRGDDAPWAGEPKPAGLLASAAGGLGPRRLVDIAALIEQATVGPGTSVAVTRIANPGRQVRWIISVPSAPLGHLTDARMLEAAQDLRAMADKVCAMAAAIALAMGRAGVPRGAQVLLNGHAQGGIELAALASDTMFANRFDVKALLAYGAPIEGFDIDPRTEVVSLCNPTDWIQALDLKALGLARHPDERENFAEHWLPGPRAASDGPLHDHAMPQYRDAIGREESAGGRLDQLIEAKGLDQFFVTDDGVASSVLVPIARAVASSHSA